MKRKEVKLVVTYTEGYEKRLTEAMLRQLSKRVALTEDKEDSKEKTA